MDLGSRQEVLDCRGAIDRVGNRQSSVWRQNDTAHVPDGPFHPEKTCEEKLPELTEELRKKARILVVDDNDIHQESIMLVLQGLGPE